MDTMIQKKGGDPAKSGRRVGAGPGLSEASREFEVWTKRVRSEWSDRQSSFTGKDFEEKPDDWFRRTAYLGIKRIVKSGDTDIFDEIILDYARRTAGKTPLGNQPFKKGLLAMFPDERDFDRRTRMRWGDRFEYAYRNRVLAKYLNGFIRQSGSDPVIRKKLKKNHTEPGFKPRNAT